jgi:hypothetical protein
MVRQRGKGMPATFEDWLKTDHAKQRIAIGDTGAVDDMRAWYSRTKPKDVTEKTMAYYHNPKRDSEASKWLRKNSKTILRTALSGVGGIVGGPLGAIAGTAAGAAIGDALETANQEGSGFSAITNLFKGHSMKENIHAAFEGKRRADALRQKGRGFNTHVRTLSDDWNTIPNLYPTVTLK